MRLQVLGPVHRHRFLVPEQNIVNTLGMIIRMYRIIYAISVHYEHRSGQSKKECSYPVPSEKTEKRSTYFPHLVGFSPHEYVDRSGFVLGGSLFRSGREAGSQYRYGGRI